MGGGIYGTASSDKMGRDVSLSATGTIMAVSAASGLVRVLRWSGSSWLKMGQDLSGESPSLSLSADGHMIAIGSPANSLVDTDAGMAKVYRYERGVWTQLSVVTGNQAYDSFGTDVSLSADGLTLAVGAPGASNYAGYAYVYTLDETDIVWIPKGDYVMGDMENDELGTTVRLSGNGDVLAVGSNLNSDAGAAAGHTRIYFWDGSAWLQVGADIDGVEAGANSGYAIDLDYYGFQVVIGAIRDMVDGVEFGSARTYWNEYLYYNVYSSSVVPV